LDNYANLKITDFGHARIFSKGWDVFSPELVGSLYHVSPEQIFGVPYSGEKIDIWAIGVLLYRLVVGVPPFNSSDPNEFCESIKESRFFLPDSLSDDLKDILTKILHPEAEKRPTLDDILSHPWCQGTTKKPNLMRQKINLPSESEMDDCWDIMKDLFKTLNIHFIENDQPTSESNATSNKLLKCTFPLKDLKFKVEISRNHCPKHQHAPFFDFNLKRGESSQFKKTIDKIRVSFKQKCAELKNEKNGEDNKQQEKEKEQNYEDKEELEKDEEDKERDGDYEMYEKSNGIGNSLEVIENDKEKDKSDNSALENASEVFGKLGSMIQKLFHDSIDLRTKDKEKE